MCFDYRSLNSKIIEEFGTQANFSDAMEMSERSLSLKLNNKVSWKDKDIEKARKLLGIKEKDIHLYFFKPEVQIF